MTDPHLITALLTLLYALVAAVDGLWLHLWRYRLHVRAPTEHAVHTLRAVLFPIVVATLLMGWATGVVLWLGALITALDLLLVARNAAMETHTRDFQHGLPAGEAALHTLLQALHATVLSCAIAVRPWSAWTTASPTEVAPGALAHWIFVVVLVGSSAVAVIHVVLSARGARVAAAMGMMSRTMRRKMERHLQRTATTSSARSPARLLVRRRHLTLRRRTFPSP
ncbi:MAG TPA: hypothetical protein VHX44_08370 [Planctomycetota bacterium]|nr:hypothetical protein [Planctomycetota bacterium]